MLLPSAIHTPAAMKNGTKDPIDSQ